MTFMKVRKDEWIKVALTWAMSALLSIGYAIGWSAVHSMLVKRMGVEYLPYTYIGISLLGIAGSSVYLYFADSVRRDRLLVAFAAATGLMLVLARLTVDTRHSGETGFSLPLMLFFGAIFFAQGVGNSTLGTQVWTIINDLFKPSQGRRLYPIIGTAGTIGGILGGASIHFLADRLGTPNLVLIWAATIWLLIPLTWWTRKRFGGELRGRSPGPSQSQSGQLREGWRFFKGSRMALTLGLVAILFWVVGSLGDFQFTRIMSATFHSEAKLAGFYGIYGMVINGTGLLVQLFFSGYLIRRIGVSRGLCALPATGLLGFSLVMGSFTFLPGLFLRCSWDMVGMTIQGNSYQMALNAIPAALRARIRGFIEGVINPLGGVLGGLLILALHHAFDATRSQGWRDPITLAGLALAFAWLVAVLRSQRDYMELVASNLHSPEPRTAMDAIECLEEPHNPRAAALLDEVAQMPDPAKRAAAARVRGNLHSPESMGALCQACSDPDAKVRAEAVRSLMRYPTLSLQGQEALEHLLAQDPEAKVRAEALQGLLQKQTPQARMEMATRWLHTDSAPVRARVVEALGTLGGDGLDLLEKRLQDDSPQVRAAAAQALWQHPTHGEAAQRTLETLLNTTEGEGPRLALTVCHRLGVCPVPEAPARLLGSEDPIVRVLAGAAVLRFPGESIQGELALQTLCAVLVDPTQAERLDAEVVPLLPDLGEEASDGILMAILKLPGAQREQATHVLGQWFTVLNASLTMGEA